MASREINQIERELKQLRLSLVNLIDEVYKVIDESGYSLLDKYNEEILCEKESEIFHLKMEEMEIIEWHLTQLSAVKLRMSNNYSPTYKKNLKVSEGGQTHESHD